MTYAISVHGGANALDVAAGVLDLSQIEPPAVIEALDYERTRADLIEAFRQAYPEWNAVLESDPVVKLLEIAAYRELLLRQRINEAARAVMLSKAVGTDLDQLGANVQVSRLDGEADDRYRGRVQQGFSRLGAAGTANTYLAHAFGLGLHVADAAVTKTGDGQVTLTMLAQQTVPVSGATPDERIWGQAAWPDQPDGQDVTILARIDSGELNEARQRLEEIKAFTDDLVIRPPAVVPYTVNATLFLYPGPDRAVVLSSASTALASHLAKQRRIGFDVARSGIMAALSVPGVQSVMLSSPATDLPVSSMEIALPVDINVDVGGINV